MNKKELIGKLQNAEKKNFEAKGLKHYHKEG